jgi:hypothetical protein
MRIIYTNLNVFVKIRLIRVIRVLSSKIGNEQINYISVIKAKRRQIIDVVPLRFLGIIPSGGFITAPRKAIKHSGD